MFNIFNDLLLRWKLYVVGNADLEICLFELFLVIDYCSDCEFNDFMALGVLFWIFFVKLFIMDYV